MFDYQLALMTGVDIPVPELQITIHQPTIKEISMIGETDFFMGVQLLCINKELYLQEQPMIAETTNFQLFITMMNEKQIADKKEAVLQVLQLLIPGVKVLLTPRSMLFNFGDANITIDEQNFEFLQNILKEQFCLSGSGQEVFNPQSKKAKEIAQKLMRARQRVAAQKEHGSGSQFAQYLSVITTGFGSMSLNDCLNLTMYQMYDLVERYSLYLNWDIDIRSRLAGAKGDKPVENWMKNIH